MVTAYIFFFLSGPQEKEAKRKAPRTNDHHGLNGTKTIVVAAYKLETEEKKACFTLQDLAVAAWQQSEKLFGMRDKDRTYPYPDSNKVTANVAGKNGVVKQGYLLKPAQNIYVLSKKGRTLAQQILGYAPTGPSRNGDTTVRMQKNDEETVLTLLESEAYQKFQKDPKTLTASDAWFFWGLSEKSTGDEVDDKLGALCRMLERAERLLVLNRPINTEHEDISRTDISLLWQMHQYFEERFFHNLNILRIRERPRR